MADNADVSNGKNIQVSNVKSSTKHADVILESEPSDGVEKPTVTEEAPKKKKVAKKKKTDEEAGEEVTKKKLVKKKKSEDGESKPKKKSKEKESEDGVVKKKSSKKKKELDTKPDDPAVEASPDIKVCDAIVDESCNSSKAPIEAALPTQRSAISTDTGISEATTTLETTSIVETSSTNISKLTTVSTAKEKTNELDALTVEIGNEIIGFLPDSKSQTDQTTSNQLSPSPSTARSCDSLPRQQQQQQPRRLATVSPKARVENFATSAVDSEYTESRSRAKSSETMATKTDFEKDMDEVRQRADDLVNKILKETRSDKYKVDMGGGGPSTQHTQEYRSLTSAFEDDNVGFDYNKKRGASVQSDADVGRSLLERRLDSMRLGTEERTFGLSPTADRRSTARMYDQQMADEYGDAYRQGSGFGFGAPRRGPRSVISEDDFETGSFFTGRRRLARQDYMDDSSDEEITFEEADFVPEKREATDELVKEKSREARSVVDNQEDVVNKLRRASESFDETLAEIKAMRETFLESQYRRHAVLEDLEVDKIRMMDEYEDRRHGGRSRMTSYVPYAPRRPLKLDKELEDDAPILRGKALSSLATAFGSGKASNNPYEEEYEPDTKPQRKARFDAWDTEDYDMDPRTMRGASCMDDLDHKGEHPSPFPVDELPANGRNSVHPDNYSSTNRLLGSNPFNAQSKMGQIVQKIIEEYEPETKPLRANLQHENMDDDLDYRPLPSRLPSSSRLPPRSQSMFRDAADVDQGYDDDLESVSVVGGAEDRYHTARTNRWTPRSFSKDSSEVPRSPLADYSNRETDKHSASSGYSSGSSYTGPGSGSRYHFNRSSTMPDYSTYGGSIDGESLMGRSTYHATTGSGSRFLQKVRERKTINGDESPVLSSSGKKDRPFKSRFLRGSAADLDISKYSVSNYFSTSTTSSSAQSTATNGAVDSLENGSSLKEAISETKDAAPEPSESAADT